MVDNRANLEHELERWLDKSSPELADTRKFLGSDSTGKRSGLSDGQIANWRRRRRLPDTFVEGAALYHCALARTGRLDPAQWTGIAGDSFWQVFVVADTVGPKLDCTILRFWKGVRTLDDTKPKYLTHIAHRSTDKAARTREPSQLGRKDDSFDCEADDDGSVFVSWKIGLEPRDYGYELEFPNAIVNDHNEAVGGLSTIDVGSAHMLVFLPQRAVDRLVDMRMPGNPFGLPGAFSTLLQGDGVRVMESYLGIRKSNADGDFRRLGPWFEQGPQVNWGLQDHSPPQAIGEHRAFKEATKSAQEGKCRLCSLHVVNPLPFLSYFVVF